MKVKIEFTVNLDDEARRAIGAYCGGEKLASRKTIKKLYENMAVADVEAIIHEGLEAVKDEESTVELNASELALIKHGHPFEASMECRARTGAPMHEVDKVVNKVWMSCTDAPLGHPGD